MINIINRSDFLKKNATILLVIFLVILAFLLRFYLIPENLFFGPEQGRDFLVVKDILYNHHATLIGSKTDVGGVFHGPVFYYLILIPFLVSMGNPIFVSGFLIVIHSLSVFLIYILAKEMFNKRIAIISSIIFTFSFGLIAYSRWLSNPPLSIPLSIIFIYFLHGLLKGKRKFLIPLAISFGILGQAEFINFIFFGFILLISFLKYHGVFLKDKFIFISSIFFAGVFSFGTYLLFDIRHNFLISKSVFNLISGKSGFHIGMGEIIPAVFSSYLSSLGDFTGIINTVFSIGFFLVGVVVLVKIYKSFSIAIFILSLWIVSPIICLVILRNNPLEHLFLGIYPAFAILLSLLIFFLFKSTRIQAVILITYVVISLVMWKTSLPMNKNMNFQSTQPDLYYRDETLVVKKILSLTRNNKFEFQAYTIPYWSPDAWDYLFWYYGRNQGYSGSDPSTEKLFVIIQPDPNNKIYQDGWLRDTVANWGKQELSFKIGSIDIRQINKNK
jgi:hypothetical protein